MRKDRAKQAVRMMCVRGVPLAAAIALAGLTTCAQTTSGPPAPPEPPKGSRSDKPEIPADFATNGPEEMRKRLELKAEQKAHEENVARAREVSELGAEVLDGYKTSRTIGAEAAKKLDRLEKLTRKIRSEAGGLNGESEFKDPPHTLQAAVERVADLAAELKKDVEKTPRRVISAAVIDHANGLLGLLQYVRKLTR